MCHKIPLRAPLALLLAIGLMPILSADEDEQDTAALDRTPEDCISINRIRDTDVINDTTIVFDVGADQYYSNILERKCPGLGQHKRFMYGTSSSRLCDIDTITVLEQWGAGLQRGFSCQLGKFHPITEIEAQELEHGPDETAALENDIEIEDGDAPPDESEPEAEADAEP